MLTTRVTTPDDAEAVLAVERAVAPYKVRSLDTWRHLLADEAPARHGRRVVALVEGQVVGYGAAALNIYTSVEGAATLTVSVVPHARRRGVGTALLTDLQRHLTSIGAQHVECFATDDSLGFAEAQGFTPSRPVRYLGLNLDGELPVPPAVQPALLPMSEVEPSAVYECDVEASLDEPGDVPFDAVSYEDWLRDLWQSPRLDAALSRAAVDGDRVVAFTFVERADTRVWSGMTGVRRSHRGQGLAKAVKAHALAAARSAGATQAFTSIDESNSPMRAVNSWLGYQVVATQYPTYRS